MASLTNLAQIKGGLALQNRVTALETSYQAAKVLTTIAKDGENAGNYNVDELLADLKTGLADLAGDGSGEGLSLASLNTALNNLKNQYVKDAVRVQATATYTAGDPGSYTITLPSKSVTTYVAATGTFDDSVTYYSDDQGTVADVTGKSNGDSVEGLYVASISSVPFSISDAAPSFDTATELKVFTADNETVFDTNGDQLTYDFATNSFSGTPAKLDVAASKADTNGDLHYTALNETFDFKVFPVGRFTIATLPEDSLLDNSELELIAYDQAINKIVVELAKDQDVIDAITAKVGNETVANQIAAITDALDSRLDDVEALADNNKDRLDAVEAMFVPVDEWKTVTDTGVEDQETHEITYTPVTSWVLNDTPNDVKVKMFVNSLTYIEGKHLSVNRATKTVTWTFTEAQGGFDIDVTLADEVMFEYFVGSAAPDLDEIAAAEAEQNSQSNNDEPTEP